MVPRFEARSPSLEAVLQGLQVLQAHLSRYTHSSSISSVPGTALDTKDTAGNKWAEIPALEEQKALGK